MKNLLPLFILLFANAVCFAQTQLSLLFDDSWTRYPSVYSRTDSCGVNTVCLSHCDSAQGLQILYNALERCRKTDSKNYIALQAAVHFINMLPDHLKRGIYYESYQCQLDKTGTYKRGKRKENETEELIGCEE